jgi:hypothetical protein
VVHGSGSGQTKLNKIYPPYLGGFLFDQNPTACYNIKSKHREVNWPFLYQGPIYFPIFLEDSTRPQFDCPNCQDRWFLNNRVLKDNFGGIQQENISCTKPYGEHASLA